MSAVVEQADQPQLPANTPGPGAPAVTKRKERIPIGLFGIPIFVVILLGAWFIWRTTADLSEVDLRTLGWSPLGAMTWQHLKITVVGTVIVMIISIPLGVALTRPRLRKFAGPVTAFANGGQAAPSIGLLVLLAMWLGFGFWTAIVGLGIYAILPVLRNTITGLDGVDPTLTEAGRGMGMSGPSVLLRIEIPLAIPVIMSGVRTALVLMVGTASLATFIGAGGLGQLITTGVNLFRNSILITGSLLIAALALLIDWIGRLLEYIVRPKGMTR
jgi:osmoprotectant transport system permease protein